MFIYYYIVEFLIIFCCLYQKINGQRDTLDTYECELANSTVTTDSCSPLISSSLDIECTHKNNLIPCAKPLKLGTSVQYNCKNKYRKISNFNQQNLCQQDSSWSEQIPYCIPECGLSRENQNSPNANNEVNAIEENPWVVSIYTANNEKCSYICPGTLILPRIVLTSASCLMHNQSTVVHPDQLRVIAGNLKNYWNSSEDEGQRAKVWKIIIKPNYSGISTSFSNNLALIGLARHLKLADTVLPICLNRIGSQIPENTAGLVVGWEENSFNSDHEGTLKQYRTTTVSCRNVPANYFRYLSSDKSCIKSEIPFRKISGEAFITKMNNIHYLNGIISEIVNDQNNVAAMINLKIHANWLKKATSQLDKDLTLASESLRKTKNLCSNCPANSFQCENGDCINMNLICNGRSDCEDNSDESPNKCEVIQPLRAEYCPIPKSTEGGGVQIESCGTAGCGTPPITKLGPKSVIRTVCTQGYGISELGIDRDLSVCLSGEWIPPPPICTHLCEPLRTDSLDLECIYKGEKVKCNKRMTPGTMANYNCSFNYMPQNEEKFSGFTTCQTDGTWTEILPVCVPICGIPGIGFDNVKTLISGGTLSKVGKYPWHVGLWRNQNNKWVHICGGTLITPSIVLTAAHCVYDNREVLDPAEIKVAAGKYYRSWYKKDIYSQKRKVWKILPGDTYNGLLSNYADDIALLAVEQRFTLSTTIMPACLDMNRRGIPSDEIGTIVGWGKTGEDEGFSEELKEAHLKFMGLTECRNYFTSVGSTYIRFLTYDKFCVSYENGTTGPQGGDSGGGITFPRDKFYYIYGIVSSKQQGTNDYSAFTDVMRHLDWLKKTLTQLETDLSVIKGFDDDADRILKIVSKDEWQAQPQTEEIPFLRERPAPYVIIAHTAGLNCSSPPDCAELVRNIQSNHLAIDYGDIGYSFLVGGDGNVYEGRGWDKHGAHSLPYNRRSIGVAFIGNFMNKTPPPRQINAVKELLEEGLRLRKLARDYKVYYQKQVIPTESPGSELIKEVMSWPHWSEYQPL